MQRLIPGRTLAAAALVAAACAACASTAAPAAAPAVLVSEARCYFFRPVHFAGASAVVGEDAGDIIADMATAMKSDPDAFVLVELVGSASRDEGDPVGLARERASAVRAALVARGVEPERIRARGYGAHCPLGATLEDSQRLDRRVELKVIRTRSGETGTELGCDAATDAGGR
jgi:outer membrane protein OmpA-like peptidoglycan-associated protein